jgi:hypothetical protein
MISDSNTLQTQVTFKGSDSLSTDLMRILIDSQSNQLGKSLQYTVTLLSGGTNAYFQYRLLNEKSLAKSKPSHPIRVSDHDSAGKALHLKYMNSQLTGVYLYWDATKVAGASVAANMFKGDEYLFTANGGATPLFSEGDANSAHRSEQCSGRGSCDFQSGKCSCQAGYTGSACQRST